MPSFIRQDGFARDDTVEARLGKLRALLAPGTRDDDDIALLSELLSLQSSAAHPQPQPAAQTREAPKRSCSKGGLRTRPGPRGRVRVGNLDARPPALPFSFGN